jgi:hypothetical protein
MIWIRSSHPWLFITKLPFSNPSLIYFSSSSTYNVHSTIPETSRIGRICADQSNHITAYQHASNNAYPFFDVQRFKIKSLWDWRHYDLTNHIKVHRPWRWCDHRFVCVRSSECCLSEECSVKWTLNSKLFIALNQENFHMKWSWKSKWIHRGNESMTINRWWWWWKLISTRMEQFLPSHKPFIQNRFHLTDQLPLFSPKRHWQKLCSSSIIWIAGFIESIQDRLSASNSIDETDLIHLAPQMTDIPSWKVREWSSHKLFLNQSNYIDMFRKGYLMVWFRAIEVCIDVGFQWSMIWYFLDATHCEWTNHIRICRS